MACARPLCLLCHGNLLFIAFFYAGFVSLGARLHIEVINSNFNMRSDFGAATPTACDIISPICSRYFKLAFMLFFFFSFVVNFLCFFVGCVSFSCFFFSCFLVLFMFACCSYLLINLFSVSDFFMRVIVLPTVLSPSLFSRRFFPRRCCFFICLSFRLSRLSVIPSLRAQLYSSPAVLYANNM